tara:strand:- start:1034 stop:1867 length:834 start_codon:yes stop_codon:yes gene_type:complete
MPTKVAYLGPSGTYAEEATSILLGLEKLVTPTIIPYTGLRSVIDNLTNKVCDAAVVPIENSVEGGVTATLDALWNSPQLFIRRAIVLPINHSLLSSGVMAEISEVLSHPQALAQCSTWLHENLPNAIQLPTNSTAEAVRMVKGSKFRAAIGPRSFSAVDSVQELAFPINDVKGNRTRFVLLQREEKNKTGDIASIAFSLHENAPGALLKVLDSIAKAGLNMSRIESRPSKRELGEYVFFVDVELSKNMINSYNELKITIKPLCEHFVDFGCYPNTNV